MTSIFLDKSLKVWQIIIIVPIVSSIFTYSCKCYSFAIIAYICSLRKHVSLKIFNAKVWIIAINELCILCYYDANIILDRFSRYFDRISTLMDTIETPIFRFAINTYLYVKKYLLKRCSPNNFFDRATQTLFVALLTLTLDAKISSHRTSKIYTHTHVYEKERRSHTKTRRRDLQIRTDLGRWISHSSKT